MARRTRTSSSGFFLLLIARMVLAREPRHDHLEPGVVLELRHAARRHARERVHVAGQQRRHLGRRIGDEAERRPCLILTPAGVAEAVPLGQRDRRALAPALQLVRPGAHRLGGVGVRALGLDDDRPWPGPAGTGSRGRSPCSASPRCGRRPPARSMLAKVRLSLLVLFSPPARSNENFTACGVERLAVLELHALAQLEGVGLAGRARPPSFRPAAASPCRRS